MKPIDDNLANAVAECLLKRLQEAEGKERLDPGDIVELAATVMAAGFESVDDLIRAVATRMYMSDKMLGNESKNKLANFETGLRIFARTLQKLNLMQ